MVPQQLPQPRAAPILVVEDEVLTRAIMAEELRLAGFSVIEADRADEALTYIKSGEQVDLVFSDIQTPGSLDGLQLAQTLWGKYPNLPGDSHVRKCRPKARRDICSQAIRRHANGRTHIKDLSSKVSR